MIYQSEYWKILLLKNAAFLRKINNRTRWTDTVFAELEKVIFLSFYSLRKLAESQKLSDSTIGAPIKLSVYLPLGKPVTRLNWHKIDELYNLNKKINITIPAVQLCNQFIHSYVFVPYFGYSGKKLIGLFFCSDKERNRRLFSIRLIQIIKLLEKAGNDYPNSASWHFDSSVLDYKYHGEMLTGNTRQRNIKS